MSFHTRRTFLKVSGGVLGGIAVGTQVTVAERADRFILRTTGAKEFSGLKLVHDLSDEIGYVVVEGDESDLPRGSSYAPDTTISLDLPIPEGAVPADAADTADEPLYDLQWDKRALDIPETHNTTRGEGTRVSIIDTGVAARHPDLEHAVRGDLSTDFTGDGYGAGGPFGGYHGTHVAGIVAANDQNEGGVVGTAPATEIVDCRVFSPSALASFADVVAAMVYSASIGCDAANLSLGAYPVSRRGVGQFYGKILNRTTAYCRRNDTLLVVAAGNDSADLQHDGRICGDFDDDGETECAQAISLPNEAANVLSISATGPIGFGWGEAGLEESPESPAFYTNYGTNAIDLGAPGGDADLSSIGPGVAWYLDLVLNTVAEPRFDDDGNYEGADHSYGWAAGTSMAAPQVAGAAALVKSANPGYNANEVRSALERAAAVPEGYDKTYYGSGFLNVVDAL